MTFKGKLRSKIKEMIEESPKARKNHMYKEYIFHELFRRISAICLTNFDECSDPKLYDSFMKLGFLINRIKMEVGETEYNSLIEKVIDLLLKKIGEYENFRKNAIPNIDWVLKLHKEIYE